MPAPKRITARAAWQSLADGRGVLIDVREPGEFDTVRTPRALNFPLSSLEERAPDVPAGEPVFVLCAAGTRAVAAADILTDEGRDAFVVEGGMIDWRRSGLPIDIGTRGVWEMDRQVRFAAGLLVLTGLALGWFVDRRFFLFSAFVGGGLVVSGATGFCGMAHVLGAHALEPVHDPPAPTPQRGADRHRDGRSRGRLPPRRGAEPD